MVRVRMQILGICRIFLSINKDDWGVKEVIDCLCGKPDDLSLLMRILKLAKYRLKAQVEKDEGPSGEGQSPRVEKDEGPEAETLSRLLIVAEGPN